MWFGLPGGADDQQIRSSHTVARHAGYPSSDAAARIIERSNVTAIGAAHGNALMLRICNAFGMIASVHMNRASCRPGYQNHRCP
jgi:hypothetical protein